MPRNPSTHEFFYSAGVPVTFNDILDSSDYNAAIQDLATDFNAPLPIEMGGTGANSLATALTNLDAVSSFYLSDLFAGAVCWFARSDPPTGWLIAQGQAVKRSDYPTLYQRIGTLYGSGDGSTTFTLPDLRGYFIRGADLGKGTDAGRAVGTNQADDNKGHTHAGTATANTGHNHATFRTALAAGPSPPVNLVLLASHTGTITNYRQTQTQQSTGSVANHTHTVTIASTGNEFRPRNLALLGCIKA